MSKRYCNMWGENSINIKGLTKNKSTICVDFTLKTSWEIITAKVILDRWGQIREWDKKGRNSGRNGDLIIMTVWHSLEKNKVGGSGLETIENGVNDD